MNDYFDLNLSNDEIIEVTNHAETINHGKASGLDAATVNSDYLVFFNKKSGPSVLRAKLNATLLIMDTGELGSTKKAVAQVQQQVQSSPVASEKIKCLGQLADDTKQAWVNQDRVSVGKIFNEAEEILDSFGLATIKIKQLQQLALENGALGFKLSGSGLGGIVIVLCDNIEVAKSIAKKCQKIGRASWRERG